MSPCLGDTELQLFPADQGDQAVDAVLQVWKYTQAVQKQQAIQADQVQDANPWLRMTG
ncbi:uncharacterized protein BP01DRAFT_385554 [Aspergillus saccharolyticus JOP 1030-1]|uniref:Uncharacterized protein n=1 Tax=Aspergillus saccharolyticus JOP 1030-1 TaxID=1450539 RepID=A0A318ZF44_9EURO|nr:hypothetical protein BP01DRAFT_385554 [Aspergillus saccharolyticus JOP 1030-1]PYH42230.1 hypothetical protein BP01DRAFT_385554 [Aspergillus saccharolyticus JOP 1030-1]